VFSLIKGHTNTIELLKGALDNPEGVPPVYLFAGVSGVGKRLVAFQTARYVNCTGTKMLDCGCKSCTIAKAKNHPGIITYAVPKRGVFSVGMARNLKSESDKRPFIGKYKVFIIEGFHKATGEASNALLKLLEEPPSYCIIILLTDDLDRTMDTILSRCFSLNFFGVDSKYITEFLISNLSIESKKAGNIAKLAGGSFSKAMEFLSADRHTSRKILFEMLLRLSYTTDKTILSTCTYFKENFNIHTVLEDILMFFLDVKKFQMGIRELTDDSFDVEALSLMFTPTSLDSALGLLFYTGGSDLENKEELFLSSFFLDVRGIMRKEYLFGVFV